MRIIVGLGNPGEKYAHTRHNAGFDTLDILSVRLNIPIKKLKFQATIGEGLIGTERVVLIKPQTFMNLSGMTVSEALNWYKIEPRDVLLIVDDIDLPFGQVRLRAKGGPGTHNGLRSIAQHIPDGSYDRLRVGVGTPPPEIDLVNWVLGRPQDMSEVLDRAAEAARDWFENGVDHAMSHYNGKITKG